MHEVRKTKDEEGTIANNVTYTTTNARSEEEKKYTTTNARSEEEKGWGRNIGKQRHIYKKGKKKVQGVPQSQTAALPRHQEEEETDKSKQAQIEQTYEKH